MAMITAGTWLLESTIEEASTELFFPNEKPESVFLPDKRVLVDPKEFAPGGRYRSIVKLQMRYERQAMTDDRWAMGTGWLIRPDLLVTAGHCVYDWTHKFGRCVKVKAYIGYNGAASVTSPDHPDVQFRHGKRVVTTDPWLKSGDNQPNDLSFIQLDQPFTGIEPFTFRSTPITGSVSLGIVGYPGDRRHNNDPNGEQGAQMYEDFGVINWDLAKSNDNMLEYRIDTYAGQSGSPVLRQSDFKVIGTHVFGSANANLGTTINGIYGNPYESYICIFDSQYPTIQKLDGITYVRVPLKRTGAEALVDGFSSEEFWNDLKSAIAVAQPIPSDVLGVKTLAFGPVSAPITALAGTALGKFARLGSDFVGQVPDNTHIYRAVVAEAALWVVEDMDDETVRTIEIVETMKSIYSDIAPQAKLLAPKLLPVLMDLALRVALDALQKQQSGPESESPSNGPPQRLKVLPQTSQPLEPLTRKLLEPTVRVTRDEGFWNALGNVLSAAGQANAAIPPAKDPLNHLVPNTQDTLNHLQQEGAMVDFIKRAIMGEAVLQALQKINPEHLEYLESEGCLASLKSTVQKIGPAVVKLAPSVIEAMELIAGV